MDGFAGGAVARVSYIHLGADIDSSSGNTHRGETEDLLECLNCAMSCYFIIYAI